MTPDVEHVYAVWVWVVVVGRRVFSWAIGDRWPRWEWRRRVLYRVSRRKASSLASGSLDQAFRPLSVSLLKAALKLSAAVLSALEPPAPMLCPGPC